MDGKELEVALSLLIDDMEGDQSDQHETYIRLRTIFKGTRAMGRPLPDDLVRLEEEVAAELAKDRKNSDRL